MATKKKRARTSTRKKEIVRAARKPARVHKKAPVSSKKKGPKSAGGKRAPTRARSRRRVSAPSSPKKRAVSRSVAEVRPARLIRRKVSPSPEHRVKLRESLNLVRKHINGYEAKDGWSLRALEKLPASQQAQILTKAAKLRELLNAPHDLIKPRTKKGRKNLIQFTRQTIRHAKHFIVHKPSDSFSVRLKDGNVEVEGRLANRVITRSAFYLFPHKPRRPKELVSMARKLKREMPPGYYVLLTAAHGDTGEPFDREQLLNRLNEYLAAYEVDSAGRPTGFSEALIGFRFMSTTLQGASVQRQTIDRRRAKQREFNQKRRKQLVKLEKKRVKKRVKKEGKIRYEVWWIKRNVQVGTHSTIELAIKRIGRLVAMSNGKLTPSDFEIRETLL